MKRTGVNVELPETQRLTRQALKLARQSLLETSKKSFPIRQAELQQDIQSADQDDDRHRKKALKAIKKAEEGQKTYRIIRAMRTDHCIARQLDRVEIPNSWPPVHQPLDSVDQLEDPKTCNSWRLVTEPTEIEYYLMLRNRLHFGQAEGTPFTRPPLQPDVDWSAMSVAAEQNSTRLLNSIYSHITMQ